MITRRAFLKTCSAALLTAGVPSPALAAVLMRHSPPLPADPDFNIKDYLSKMRDFNLPHKDDILLGQNEMPLLQSSLARLIRLQATIGQGNFYILGFDDALRCADTYPRIGTFPRREIDFLERLFHHDGRQYGFFGEKPIKHITDRIDTRDVVKIQRTGNYLFKGDAVKFYTRIQKEIGPEAILTSGVRSVMKQFLLYLAKAHDGNGNLSLASRSLAPPGYSYHGVGDFDVGKVGYGVSNFTERFTQTDVFKRLEASGYLTLRYTRGNLFGVRYEPWHVKVS